MQGVLYADGEHHGFVAFYVPPYSCLYCVLPSLLWYGRFPPPSHANTKPTSKEICGNGKGLVVMSVG